MITVVLAVGVGLSAFLLGYGVGLHPSEDEVHFAPMTSEAHKAEMERKRGKAGSAGGAAGVFFLITLLIAIWLL